MGAFPYPDGATFRTWAPSATSVHVAGEFNGWSATATPLQHEAGGYWSAYLPGAKAGQQYKFVITNHQTGQQPLWRNDPYARALSEPAPSPENSVIAEHDYAWQAAGYETPAWNDMVIYEMHIGTFVFDPSNHHGGRGTFASAVTKLDYLRDLGVNAIEIMAAGEFDTDTSWGYNPAYIYAIEHSFGGPNGFRRFVDECHRRGIAVIFDVVYNHLGNPAGDVWQFDGWSPDPKANTGGIYFYNDERKMTPWGDTRLDYGRPEVRAFIRENALRWLTDRYVDGLRWDATGYIRNIYGNNNDPAHDIADGWRLMQEINGDIEADQPWKISIAEDMQDNSWITRDAGTGGAGFDSQWGAGFMHTLRNAVIASDDAQRDMFAVARAIAGGDACNRVLYTESHDEVGSKGSQRVPEMIWPGHADSYFSKKRSTLGAAVVFTSPGIPMIFQGQEFLEDRFFTDSRELDWTKATRNSGLVTLYRDLIRLRRNCFNNTRGLRGNNANVFHVNNDDKVIAFHRWENGGPGDDVIVVANFGNRAFNSYNLGMPRAGTWWVRFNSDARLYSPDFGDTFSYDTTAVDGGRDNMPFNANVGIGPYTALILSQ